MAGWTSSGNGCFMKTHGHQMCNLWLLNNGGGSRGIAGLSCSIGGRLRRISWLLRRITRLWWRIAWRLWISRLWISSWRRLLLRIWRWFISHVSFRSSQRLIELKIFFLNFYVFQNCQWRNWMLLSARQIGVIVLTITTSFAPAKCHTLL